MVTIVTKFDKEIKQMYHKFKYWSVEHKGWIHQRELHQKMKWKMDDRYYTLVRNLYQQEEIFPIKIQRGTRGSSSTLICCNFNDKSLCNHACPYHEQCKGREDGPRLVSEFTLPPMRDIILVPKYDNIRRIDRRTVCKECIHKNFCDEWVNLAIFRLAETERVYIFEGLVSHEELEGVKAGQLVLMGKRKEVQPFPCMKMIQVFYEYLELQKEMV